MKLLVGTDLHNDARAMRWFCELADTESPDVVVFLGDFITFSPMTFARQAIRDLSTLSDFILAIPGNCDPRDILLDLERAASIISLHNCQVEVLGVKFAGKGGSIHCPAPTPFEEDDETFATSLERVAEGAEILVLHQPVKGHHDTVQQERHVGSESLRILVERVSPRLVLSGHIHEAKGVEREGATVFVSPGPLLNLNAAMIEYGDEIDVRFLEAGD